MPTLIVHTCQENLVPLQILSPALRIIQDTTGCSVLFWRLDWFLLIKCHLHNQYVFFAKELGKGEWQGVIATLSSSKLPSFCLGAPKRAFKTLLSQVPPYPQRENPCHLHPRNLEGVKLKQMSQIYTKNSKKSSPSSCIPYSGFGLQRPQIQIHSSRHHK